LSSIDRITRYATRWLALLGFGGLLVLAIMTAIDVLSRSLLSAPIHGVNDVSSVVMAVVIASCIPASLYDRSNISVEILGSMGGPSLERVFRAFSSLVVLIFMSLMAWYFVPYTEETYRTARQTWVLAWPVWPWWAAATAFLFLAAFVQLLNFINDIIVMVTGGRVDPQGVETKLVPSRNPNSESDA